MKNKIVKNKGLRKIFFALAGGMVFFSMFLIGCQSEASLEQEQKSEAGVEYPIPQDAVVFIEKISFVSSDHFRAQQLKPHGDAVHFFGAAAFYYLPKDIKNYATYRQLLEESTKLLQEERKKLEPLVKGDREIQETSIGMLKFTLGNPKEAAGGAIPVLKVEKPTTEELEARLLKFSTPTPKIQARQSLRSKMTLTKAQEFFTRFQNLSCDRSSQNPCIPFRFAADGCYAGAHYMRKLMAEAGYDCKKLFAIAQTNALQVHTGTCCVAWGYHVAPAVHVEDGYSSRYMVLDPSLFSGPVDYLVWRDKMKSNCQGYGIPNIRLETKASDVYAYNPYTGQWVYDNNYSKTMSVLGDYRYKSGCIYY